MKEKTKDLENDKRDRWERVRKKLTTGDYKLIEELTGYSYSYIEKMFRPVPVRPVNGLVLSVAERILSDRDVSKNKIKSDIAKRKVRINRTRKTTSHARR